MTGIFGDFLASLDGRNGGQGLDQSHIGVRTNIEVPGYLKTDLERLYEIPRYVSKNTLVREADMAGRDAASVAILKRQLALRAQRIRSAVTRHSLITGHVATTMRATQQVTRTDAKHVIDAETYLLDQRVERQRTDGFQQALEGVRAGGGW
ncbi:MAG TPA: hypothetical protein V6D29_13175 [Leptolyngbyaceae cyanobacterium]